MHDFADGTAASYIKRAQLSGKTITENSVFEHVLEKVKKAYPEKFDNPNRQRSSSVSAGDRNGKPGKGNFKLTDEEEKIAKNWERSGVMSRDEYIKELKEMRGVE
jgi:hypothetical protein